MMDDLTDIREFYNAAWDAEANRLERHQLEADITWRYLNLYLPPHGRLLEIGFGTGYYTFPLVQNKAWWLHPDTYSTSDRNQTIKKEVSIRHNGDCSLTLWPTGFG